MRTIEISIVCYLKKSLSIVKSFCYNLRIQNENLEGGLVQMSDQAKFNKEIQDRKKEFQDKKIELISRLCAEETVENKGKIKKYK